jgi:hypothetical protein
MVILSKIVEVKFLSAQHEGIGWNGVISPVILNLETRWK